MTQRAYVNMEFQQSPQNGMYDASSFIDPSAIANNQMNGARQFPMSSVPQKRDSTGAALSRSQTPSQQPQFGFQQQGFSHTPSPTLQNQHFRQSSMVPQRMQSPAQNPHAPQMSPMNFPQGAPIPQGFDPSAGAQFQGVQLSQNLQSRQQEAQRRYAQQQQQQMGNMAGGNMAAQQRTQPGQMPGMEMRHPGMQQRNMMPGQMPNAMLAQQQHQQASMQAQQGQQAFIKNVAAFNAGRRRPFNAQPVAAGRAVNLQTLYTIVMKFKGWQVVNQTGSWGKVTQVMGINPLQFPTAPDELRQIYENNLALYEQAYWQNKQSQQQQQHQQNQQTLQHAQMKANMQQQQQQMAGMPPQMSPTRPTISGVPNSAAVNQEYMMSLQRSRMAAQRQSAELAMQQAQPQSPFDPAIQQQQQFGHMTPIQNNASLPNVNGRATPQADAKTIGSTFDPQHRKSMSRQLESTPDQVPSAGGQAATPAQIKVEDKVVETKKRKLPTNMVDGKMTYRPSYRIIDRWYGLDYESESFKKRVDELVHFQPNMPNLGEMGVIDIRALTMSIRSGLHAECRLALDVLAKLSYEGSQTLTLELEKSEDLVEVLVDYGEDQLEILANDNPEVSDIIDLMPYEDVFHNCESEVYSLQQNPEFGTKAYDLDRTADRLLAITTIFRNLSFFEHNHAALSSPHVLKFLSNAIRLVGTRVLLLRTHTNTYDFMKDLVTFFSNTSTKIELPSREEAYNILHFLCAFAPVPRPSTPVKFVSYNPRIHRCLPSAVDSLAKLLARDDPNRSYYKQIFANEATSSPPYELLTRAFGLAIAVVPDRTSGVLHTVSETEIRKVSLMEAKIAEQRKPYLMQGMLAADILASLAPGPDAGVCRSWLESDDGWAPSLLKLSMSLCATDSAYLPPQQHDPRMGGRNQRPMDHDVQGFQLIVHRALSMLKRLGEKSRGTDHVMVKSAQQTNGHANHDDESDAEDDDDNDMDTLVSGGTVWKVKTDFLPLKETLLSAMLTPKLDVRSLRQFCNIGYLDG